MLTHPSTASVHLFIPQPNDERQASHKQHLGEEHISSFYEAQQVDIEWPDKIDLCNYISILRIEATVYIPYETQNEPLFWHFVNQLAGTF